MILDDLAKVVAAQQVTATAVGNNAYDTGNITPKRRAPEGEPLALVIVVKAKGTTSGSVAIQAVQSAAGNPLSAVEVLGAIAAASTDLVVGATFIIPYGHGIPAKQYLGANFVVTGTVDVTVDGYIGRYSDVAARCSDYARSFAFDLS